MRAAAALALVLVAWPLAARAGEVAPEGEEEVPPIEPDPRAVAEAREANLEPESVREGLAIGLAAGPSMQVGFGIRESTGTGGGFDLRIGTVASPRWVWLLEVASTVYLREDENGDERRNTSGLLTLGAQWYLKEAIWVRGGLGVAGFSRQAEGDDRRRDFYGVGAIGAGGLDLLRKRSFALAGEVLVTAARYRDGSVLGGSLQLGVSWY